ncbi:MAG: VIT family protein [Sphingobium sp.]|nr:MAG: VIT family protein [Sphingobium sp.]
MPHRHLERHVIDRIGWLRASILGANDGIVSTASLIAGVAAAGASPQSLLVTGIAGLVAGAMSMAAGEYVSVSSQADAERADIARETAELETQPDFEREELIAIYQKRGLDRALAEKVVSQLMANNPLEAHMRDELGLTTEMSARPVQAAFASAGSFAVGAALPLALVLLFAGPMLTWAVTGGSLLFLALLGGIGARAGGAPIAKAVLRVTFWGAVAMAATAAIGSLFGTAVA